MHTSLTYFRKITLVLIGCLGIIYLTNCQKASITPQIAAIEGGVPETTVSNFYNQFPDNQNVAWTQMAGQSWFVGFTSKNIKLGVFWDDKGHILSNGALISSTDLPNTIFKNLQKNVPSSKILNVVKMYQNSANNLITDGYMAAVQKSNRVYCVRFTDRGDFMSILPKLK